MLDKHFLNHTNKILNGIGYSLESPYFDYDEFLNAAYKALRNCRTFELAKKILLGIDFVRQNKNKIKNQILDHYKYYSSLPHEPKIYNRREDEAFITMTNYFENTVCLANFLDNECLEIVHFENYYWMDDNESIYRLKKLSSDTKSIVLVNDEDKAFWIMTLDRRGKVCFKNNRTNLSFVDTKDGIAIYDSEYMKTVHDEPNQEEMVAFLELHFPEKFHYVFLARLYLFKTNIRLEILLLFVQSIYLSHYMLSDDF